MKLRERGVRVPAPDCEIRTVLISPAEEARRPAVLLYTDIFQLTESTLRTARRLASFGFVVGVPEIYPRTELAGVALEFDDAGKRAGQAGAAATTTAQFDTDRVAVLDFMERRDDVSQIYATGFCIGGHLAFRAAFDPRVAATVCFYPTGLDDGALGADADAGSLARAADIQGRLMIVLRLAGPARSRRRPAADSLEPVRRPSHRRRTARLRRRRARLHARRGRAARPPAHRSGAGGGGVLPPGPLSVP